jgi:hypothetical protein
MESGASDASSAWVKKEAVSPASFTRIKKEPGVTPDSHAHVKKEPRAPAPRSSKKARHLTKDTAQQLEYQAPDDPEEFPSSNNLQSK